MFNTNQLVIIAGTSASGKTTLIEKIQQGDSPDLCEYLGIEDPSSWLYLEARELSQIRQPIVEKLILHYDIFAQNLQNDKFRYLYELISKSDNVVILTLCVSHKILSQRKTLRFREACHRNGLFSLRNISGFLRLCKAILDNRAIKVFALYESWSKFVNKFNVSDHLLLGTDTPSIVKIHPFKINEVKRCLMNKVNF